MAHGTTEPTARNLDCVAMPHWPASRSHAAIEYVATTSAIGELGQVEVEQSRVGDERQRDLRAGQRGLDLGRGRRAYDDGPSVRMRLAKCFVVECVEHERLRHVDLAFEGDLWDAAARCSEPSFSQSSTESPGSSCSTCALVSAASASGVPVSSPNVPQWLGTQ